MEKLKQTNIQHLDIIVLSLKNIISQCLQMKDKYTLVGNIICSQREKFPIYTAEAIAEADLFLYQIVMPMIFLK